MRRLPVILALIAMLSCFPAAAREWEEPQEGPDSPFACSCFAVYGDRPVYGMNFDYPDCEVKFTIGSKGGLRIFEMKFSRGGKFIGTVGMNSAGLFVSSQMCYPEVVSGKRPGTGEIFIWKVYTHSLPRCETVAEVLDYVSDKKAVPCTVSLHEFVADAYGNAMAVEIGGSGNEITKMDGNSMVMTNFPVCAFRGKPAGETCGVGADRYQVITRHIRKHRGHFGLEEAMGTLERAAMTGEWATRCSMVFLPENGEVYIALGRDYDHIWKLSLEEKTIETHEGFDAPWSTKVGFTGVTAAEMVHGDASAASLGPGRFVTPAIIVVGVVLLVVVGRKIRS